MAMQYTVSRDNDTALQRDNDTANMKSLEIMLTIPLNKI